MAVEAEETRYDCDGTVMHGRVYRDGSRAGPRPGIVVFPEAFGISDHTYRSARRLAELGYVALACNLHGEGYFRNSIDEEFKQRCGPLFASEDRRKAVVASP